MIRQVVIPVAGWGTRLLPATKAIPKPLLPVADLPVIHYILEEAYQSGIEHAIIVTSPNTAIIEDYFDVDPELNRMLEATGRTDVLERLQAVEDNIHVTFVRQPSPIGLGHAVLMAGHIIGNQPFGLMLGDDVIITEGVPPCLRQLIDVHDNQGGGAVISIMPVADVDIPRYGIVAGKQIDSRLIRVESMVEKPSIASAPSNLGIIGRYVLPPKVFDYLEGAEPGVNGEIQLTDALTALMDDQSVYGYQFEGTRYDTGDMIPWITSSIDIALRRPDLAPRLKEFIRSLNLE